MFYLGHRDPSEEKLHGTDSLLNSGVLADVSKTKIQLKQDYF